MIIAFSGKASSGKSTAGFISQYILENPANNYEDYINHYHDIYSFEIKKFAEPLKQMVCILLGCYMSNLEDQEFKNKELDENWWYYQGDNKLHPYNTPYKANKKNPLIKLTPRMLLQRIGTDLFREQLHPDCWVNSLMSNYKQYTAMQYMSDTEFYPNWIIDDCRFVNEMEAIKKHKNISIRINRYEHLRNSVAFTIKAAATGINNNITPIPISLKLFNIVKESEHPSETALDDYEFDYIIDNNKSLDYLFNELKRIFKKENLI